MSRMWARRPSAARAHRAILRRSRIEQQVLEVRGDRGEVLERLDRLLAALGIARAQRRGEDLLEQRRLAVGRGAEHAQVAPADAVARELGDGADDLALGLVVVADAAADLALDDAVLLELLDELGSAPVSSTTSSSEYSAPGRDGHLGARACAAVAARAGGRRPGPPRVRPAASSWRITRSGRNSSRWRRRIVRSRATSAARVEAVAARRAPRRRAASGPRGSGSWRSRCRGTPARAPCTRRRSSATCAAARRPPRASAGGDLGDLGQLDLGRLDGVGHRDR